jgi:putative phosphoesterase
MVLADTHLKGTSLPRGHRALLLDALWSRLAGADAILHAGDVLDAVVLERMRGTAPVHAVLGNNDRSLVGLLPPTRLVDIGGVPIGMVHDSGPVKGRARRMRRRFPECDVVVFGHSHAPVNELGEDGQLLFNPGSPTQRRAQPVHTMGELRIAGGAVLSHVIIALDEAGSTGSSRGIIA